MTEDPMAQALAAAAEQCRRRLRTYVREAWPIVEPATPFVGGWHLDAVCEHLQAVADGEILRLIINVPPRTGKSLTTAVFWPTWVWLRAPATRWLYASYAEHLAQRDSMKCRRVIRSAGGRNEGTLLQRLGYQGLLALLEDDPWELTDDQTAKRRFENTETGVRMATGVGGLATGDGGDFIVVDDPVSARQARSDAEREAANTWWDETMTTRFNSASAAAVLVMQRLHEQDLTGHLVEQGGWHHLCLPAEYEPSHPFVCPPSFELPSGRTLPGDPRTEEGELLDPERLPPSRLEELGRTLGSYGYAGQMQQRPAPADGGMFKRGWWRYWAPGKLPPQWQRVVASWDMRFSDSQAATTSYVVGQVWGVNGAERYLLGQIRARLSFTETVRAVQALARWMPEARAVLVERKANGAAVIDTLKAKVTGLIPIEPEGGKDVRAAAIEPLVEAGNVLLPDGEFIPAPPGYERTRVEDFLGEMSAFPNAANDDQVDAASQALNWLAHRHGVIRTTPAFRDHDPPVLQRPGLRLVGERYLDAGVAPPAWRRHGAA